MKTLSALLAATVLSLAGCMTRTMKSVSFLGNDVPYHTDPQNKDVLVYRNPNVDITAYTKFLIDPVRIFSNESHAIKPEEEAKLAESFRQKLTEVLQDGYRVVNSSGPGVLRIRTAIQDIQPAHAQFDEEKFIVLRLDTLLARVAMEIECVDSVSGERVAALIYTLEGQRYFEREKKTRLLNIRDAFGIWTTSLKKRFDAARMRPNQEFGNPNFEDDRRLHFEEGE